MTLISGYIYKGTVHIIADSAETHDNRHGDYSDKKEYISTFRESTYIDGSVAVAERAQKIYSIDGRMLITFAGSFNEGIQVIEDISKHYNSKTTIEEFITWYFENNTFPHNHFIGGFYENDIPYLFFKYERTPLQLVTENLSVVMGGADAGGINTSVVNSVLDSEKRNYSPDEALIQALSLLQVLTLTFQTIQAGIGGHFNGAYLSSDGVHWAKDTYHLLYSTVNFEKGDRYSIMRYNRDGTTFIISHTDIKRIFHPSVGCFTREEMIDRFGGEVEELTKQVAAKFYVFISYDKGTVVMINNEEGKNFRILVSEKGTMSLPPKVSEWMQTIPLPAGELGDRVHFNVFNNF